MADHDIRLPHRLTALPENDNPELSFLLGQIVEKLNAYSGDMSDIKPAVTAIATTLGEHTKTLKTVTEKLDSLETAITVRGILEIGKAWAPIIAILTALVAAGHWVWRHVQWSG